MNTYPYISKSSNSRGYLILSESKVWSFQNEEWITFNTREFKNHTPEFLANTYGEVKSKDHAEFIVKLCQENDIAVIYSVKTDDAKSFTISGGCLSLYSMNIQKLSVENLKQITIPLPPKEYLMEFEECEDEVSKDDLWPKVNDDVVLDEKKGVVKLMPDAQGYYIVAIDGIYTQCKFGEISKPKTPEQELQEDLIDIFESSLDGGHFVDNLLSKYSLTKKPQ